MRWRAPAQSLFTFENALKPQARHRNWHRLIFSMNFLVTGGAGFIGSHVCERLLRDGHHVWAFDDLNDFYDPQLKRSNLSEIQALAKPFEFIQGDLCDAGALTGLFPPSNLIKSFTWLRVRGFGQAWNIRRFTSV